MQGNRDLEWAVVHREWKSHKPARTSVFIGHIYMEENGKGIIGWLREVVDLIS